MAKTMLPHSPLSGKSARSALTYCPHCGLSLQIFPGPPGRAGPGHQMAVFQSVQGQAGDVPPGDWQKVTPVGRLNVGDVTTSLYDAFVSFSLVSIGGVGLCLYVGWPWPWSLVAGFSVALWRYFGGIHLAKSLLEIVETLTSLQEVEPVSAPAPAPVPLEVVQKNQAGIFQRMFRLSLPAGVSEAQFLEWSRGVLTRPDLTQARWVGSRPSQFVREDYVSMLAVLEECEIVRRKGKAKNSSYEFTEQGLRSLRRYILAVDDTHSHSLTRQGGSK